MKKKPTIEILGSKFIVHAGLIAADKFHEMTGEPLEEFFNRTKDDKNKKKVRIKDMVTFFYCCLRPTEGGKNISFDDLFLAMDEDPELFNTLSNILSGQTSEKKK